MERTRIFFRIPHTKWLAIRNYTNAVISDTASKATTSVPERSKADPSKLCMSAWQIHNYGGTEELQLSNKLKIPQIRNSCDCLVRVHATTVNPIDVRVLGGYGATVLNILRKRAKQMDGDIEFPLTLGREFCGVLVQKGMAVDDELVNVGERVWGVAPLNRTGTHAEYVSVPAYCLSRAPKILNDEEAASVLLGGLTAWSGLYVTGRLGGQCGAMTACGGGAGKRILVLGGSGVVGSLAIQMLKSQGAQVLATCNENAVEMVRNLGADQIVDYANPVEMQTLRTYAPYDIVLDCAGQGPEYAEQLNFNFKQYITFSAPVLRNIDESGMVVGLFKNFTNLVETNVKAWTQRGGLIKWGFFTPSPHGIEFLKGLVERQKLLPQIDSCYKFEDLPQAFERMLEGHLRGKIVVKLRD